MKKIVAAFLAGVLLMMAGQVIADTASQIGKKVDGESPVTINGHKISNAVIIEGKSYAPVRDIAEGLGASVSWKGSDGVVITREVEYNNVSFDNDEDVAAYNAKVRAYNDQKATIEGNIANSKRIISENETVLKKFTEDYINQYGNEQVRKLFSSEVEKAEKILEEEKAKLAQYEKELADLETGR